MAPIGHVGLDHLLGEQRLAARRELAEAVRTLAMAAEPVLAGSLPAAAFHEPRLYTQLTLPGFRLMSLGQLVFSENPRRSGGCLAITDKSGAASFPGLGRCRTGHPITALDMHYSAPRQGFTVLSETQGAQWYPLEPCTFIPGTDVEIVDYIDPMLRQFLEQHVDHSDQLVVAGTPHDYTPVLSEALDLIEAVRPAFHNALVESLKAILLFQHPTAASFAALGMHGMLFINVPPAATLDFFVAELAHQGGHVLFSEATLRRGDFFRVDPDERLSKLIGQDDQRSIYDTFHGLYTEHMEYQIVLGGLIRDLVPESERPHFRNHLASVAGRHLADLALIAPHAGEIFSEPGRAIFDQFQGAYSQATQSIRDLTP